MNGFQILGRHDVFVVDAKFDVGIVVAHRIAAPAHLHARTTVGRRIKFVQAQITFAGNGHAQRTMTKHFNANRFTSATTYTIFANMAINFRHLIQIEFARQHHHIGKLRVKLQRFDI